MKLFFAVVACAAVASADYDLSVFLKQHRLNEFEQLFWDIATPGHAEYLKHRTAEQVAEFIGATESEVGSVRKWLARNGGVNIRVSELRDSVTATIPDGADTAALRLTASGLPHADTHPTAVDFVLRRDALPVDISIDSATHAKLGGSAKHPDASSYTVQNIKAAYGIPVDLQATNDATTQMVWGPGTFGYSPSQLRAFKLEQCPLLNLDKVKFDTANHGKQGGDNFGEGTLDVHMISSFGLNVSTLVSNTNTSASTEETTGFGAALLDFVVSLAARPKLPQVLSMSLGSLSGASCDLLCREAVATGKHTLKECKAYISQQRQVCMFLSEAQTARINTGMQVLGTRGVTVLGSSGDGGSHFSFGKFSGGAIAETLNTISCQFQIPVYPTASPYVTSVGGEMWDRSSSKPITWAGFGGGSGGGFSIQFPAPAHQKATVAKYLSSTSGLPPASGFNASNRAYPDMSAVGVDGTSQSCPITAGIWSMIMDKRLNAGLPPLGFIGPRLYQVAEKFPGEAFEDITSGNSKTSCDNGFPATVGWDPNTGFGRPVWEGMVKHFASDTAISF
jgi:tripeptidyl-peptidase-1